LQRFSTRSISILVAPFVFYGDIVALSGDGTVTGK